MLNTMKVNPVHQQIIANVQGNYHAPAVVPLTRVDQIQHHVIRKHNLHQVVETLEVEVVGHVIRTLILQLLIFEWLNMDTGIPSQRKNLYVLRKFA